MNRLFYLVAFFLSFAGSAPAGILTDARDASIAGYSAVSSVDSPSESPEAYFEKCTFDNLDKIFVSDELSLSLAVFPPQRLEFPVASCRADGIGYYGKAIKRGHSLLRPV